VLVTPTIVDPVSAPDQIAVPQVNMPIQNLEPHSFDKGLPYPAAGSPGAKP